MFLQNNIILPCLLSSLQENTKKPIVLFFKTSNDSYSYSKIY